MNEHAEVLFRHLDRAIRYSTRAICTRVLSNHPSTALTPEQHRLLQPHVREELELLVSRWLGIMDNVGCVIDEDEHIFGWSIKARPEGPDPNGDVGEALPEVDIRENGLDYEHMWSDFIRQKSSPLPEREPRRR